MPDRVADILSAYEPTLRQRIGDATYDVARYLGMDIIANRMRGDVQAAVDFIPGVGDAVGIDEAARDYQAGNYGMAAAGLGLTAAGMVPGVGDAASAAGRKAIRFLPSSSSLNLPRSPTLEELAALASVRKVPLDMARGSQNVMDWEAFNSMRENAPMFEGYGDMPVAVMRNDGEYIIMDGHHRTAKMINEGLPEADMYVVDASAYDPQNAGVRRKEENKGLSISDLDLLSELGL